jgi:phospholipid/cholesterol/gamma-HCH transport system substrate-binding protein
MSAKTNYFKLGLFVLGGVVLFIAGLLAFGAKSYFAPKTYFETAIPGQVSGLAVGSRVEFRGVPVGKVTRISFAWSLYSQSKSRLIVVQFEVDGDLLPLPPHFDLKTTVDEATERGLRAMVKSQGITGTSILSLENLNPKDYPPLVLDYKPHYLYVPSAPAQFTRMLEAIEAALENIRRLDIEGIGQSITNTLAAVTQLADKVAKLDVQAIGTNANSLITDVRGVANQLHDAVTQVQDTIKGMKLGTVSKDADALLTELRDTNAKLQVVLDKAGASPIQQTVAELHLVLENLNGVLTELKRYPSGFLFGKPPPPVPGMESGRP